MTTFEIAKLIGTDISSRTRAAHLREDVVRAATTNDQVQLNFVDVRTISESFADELFAILINDLGEAWFRQHVKVQNIAPLPRKTVLEAIAARKQHCGC